MTEMWAFLHSKYMLYRSVQRKRLPKVLNVRIEAANVRSACVLSRESISGVHHNFDKTVTHPSSKNDRRTKYKIILQTYWSFACQGRSCISRATNPCQTRQESFLTWHPPRPSVSFLDEEALAAQRVEETAWTWMIQTTVSGF